MIHYQLHCSQHHEFDGWFRDSAAFDRQSGLGLVECPVCSDTQVTRALMAPAVSTRSIAVAEPARRNEPTAAPEPERVPIASGAVAGHLPDHLRAMLQRLRSEVERNCDYVGTRFAEEARKMHRGESDRRGIYGESTPDEAESLSDEGIDVSRIPWVPRADG